MTNRYTDLGSFPEAVNHGQSFPSTNKFYTLPGRLQVNQPKTKATTVTKFRNFPERNARGP